jgi:hypothetical protein
LGIRERGVGGGVCSSVLSKTRWTNQVTMKYSFSFMYINSAALIDDRCDNGRFRVFASCVTISNPRFALQQ